MRISYLIWEVVLAGIVAGWCPPAAAQTSIVVKIVATNPSVTSAREVEVRRFLPKGIRPEHVIDTAGLELTYSEEKGQYAVHGKHKLKPQKSATFEVEIQNIWSVEPERVDVFRKHSRQLLGQLEGTAHTPLGRKILSDIDGDLELLFEGAKKDPGPTIPVEEYIRVQKDVRDAMLGLRQKVGALEALVINSGKDPGELLGVSLESDNPYADRVRSAARRKPARTNWNLVIGVLAVLALVSVGSFLVWSRQIHRLRAVETARAAADEDGHT